MVKIWDGGVWMNGGFWGWKGEGREREPPTQKKKKKFGKGPFLLTGDGLELGGGGNEAPFLGVGKDGEWGTLCLYPFPQI